MLDTDDRRIVDGAAAREQFVEPKKEWQPDPRNRVDVAIGTLANRFLFCIVKLQGGRIGKEIVAGLDRPDQLAIAADALGGIAPHQEQPIGQPFEIGEKAQDEIGIRAARAITSMAGAANRNCRAARDAPIAG